MKFFIRANAHGGVARDYQYANLSSENTQSSAMPRHPARFPLHGALK